MTDVQFEEIVSSAITQADDQVEACVVFLDEMVGSALADCVLRAHRWSVCLAGEHALTRAMGAAMRFPELEIIVGIEVELRNKQQILRSMRLFEEMALTNVSVFACGESAKDINGVILFECSSHAQLYMQQWLACPIHTQSYVVQMDDCAQPSYLLKRLRMWSNSDTHIEMWDVHQYGDVALSLMVAAQYAAQGRQVWTVLEQADICDPEVLVMVRAIGDARLPLKCLVLLDDIDTDADDAVERSVPWSHWSRLSSWWVHMPIDAEEALVWMQSSIDHMWPSLLCLPTHWHPGLEAMHFSSVRTRVVESVTESDHQLSHEVGHNPVLMICAPDMLPVVAEAQAALAKAQINTVVSIISSVAPLSHLECGDAVLAIIIDTNTRAPIADLLLPVLRGQSKMRVEMCAPDQCQGARPQASDIAATVRRAVSEIQ